LKSPDGSLAFKWVFLYLSVPLVLWAIVSGPDPLGHLQRLINFNSLLIILAATGLFAIALLKLKLPELIFNPPEFLECQYGGWYDLTSGRLRDTGVGRYAAISVIIALSGLWRPRWRPVWIFVLATSMALLLFSGARGAFGGIVPGMGLVVLANGGKKAVIAGVAVIILLTPLALSTGAHRTFINNCIFSGLITPPIGLITPPIGLITPPKGNAQVADPAPVPATEQAQGLPSEVSEEPATTQKPLFQTELYPPEYLFGVVPKSFFRFTGRAAVWVDGLRLIKDSPVIGYGFHADRLLLNTHMHNSVMQALIQTGLLGTLLFISAMVMGWVLLLKNLRNLGRFPSEQKQLVIQAGGILAFLTVRSFPESTGAFFGVDWLILAPILLYLYTVNFPRREPKT